MGIYNPPSTQSLSYQYPGGIYRPVQNRLQDRVSFLDFGADAMGLEDSTAALTAAGNAAASVGGFVHLLVPPGTYLISASVVNCYGALSICGMDSASIFKGTQANSIMLTIQLFSTASAVKIKGIVWDCVPGLINVSPFVVGA